jgi:hypothetical protein
VIDAFAFTPTINDSGMVVGVAEVSGGNAPVQSGADYIYQWNTGGLSRRLRPTALSKASR